MGAQYRYCTGNLVHPGPSLPRRCSASPDQPPTTCLVATMVPALPLPYTDIALLEHSILTCAVDSGALRATAAMQHDKGDACRSVRVEPWAEEQGPQAKAVARPAQGLTAAVDHTLMHNRKQ